MTIGAVGGQTGRVVTLSRPGRSWRALATLAAVIGVSAGSVIGQDEWWPLGPMSQYAFLVTNDGVINSPYMEARTVDGDLVGVALSKAGLGLERSEIEGQLPRIVEQPELMQAIAVLRARRQPDQPRYAEIYLRNRQTLLGADRQVRIIDLASWVVREPDDPERGLPVGR